MKITFLIVLALPLTALACEESLSPNDLQAVISNSTGSRAINIKCKGNDCICKDGWTYEQLQAYAVISRGSLVANQSKKAAYLAAKEKELEDRKASLEAVRCSNEPRICELKESIKDGTATDDDYKAVIRQMLGVEK